MRANGPELGPTRFPLVILETPMRPLMGASMVV